VTTCETPGCNEPVHGERFCLDHHALDCPAMKSWTGGMQDRADTCMCWALGKEETPAPEVPKATGLYLRCGRSSRKTGAELGCSLPQGHKGKHDFVVPKVLVPGAPRS